jgi:hypothetical protein
MEQLNCTGCGSVTQSEGALKECPACKTPNPNYAGHVETQPGTGENDTPPPADPSASSSGSSSGSASSSSAPSSGSAPSSSNESDQTPEQTAAYLRSRGINATIGARGLEIKVPSKAEAEAGEKPAAANLSVPSAPAAVSDPQKKSDAPAAPAAPQKSLIDKIASGVELGLEDVQKVAALISKCYAGTPVAAIFALLGPAAGLGAAVLHAHLGNVGFDLSNLQTIDPIA